LRFLKAKHLATADIAAEKPPGTESGNTSAHCQILYKMAFYVISCDVLHSKVNKTVMDTAVGNLFQVCKMCIDVANISMTHFTLRVTLYQKFALAKN